MNKKLLTVLLFVSLSFNLAIVGSVLWLYFNRPCPPPPPHPNMGRFQPLPPWDKFKRDPQTDSMRVKFDDTKIALMNELAKDPVDEQKVNTIIESSLAAQNTLERTLGNRMLELRKQMSAEDARQFFSARAKHLKERNQFESRTKIRRMKHEKVICN